MTRKTDWTVLDLEGVQEVAESAARRVSEQYGGALEYDDAYQEALLILAGDPKVRDYLEGPELGLGALHLRVCQRLVNIAKPDAEKRAWERTLVAA